MGKEDDIKSLPDADLTAVAEDLKRTQQGSTDRDVDLDSDKLWTETFRKNPKDILKSYREIQSAYTRTAEENKQIKDQLVTTQEEMESLRQVAPPVNYGAQYQQYGEDEDITKFRTLQIADVLEEEAGNNPKEFQLRYGYARVAANQYPHLSRSPKGVKKLFELGDKLRTEELKNNAGKALESIFGEPLGAEEIAKLKTLVKGDRTIQSQSKNAYMPDTSTSTRSGSDQSRKPNLEFEIDESAKKGDVDGVINSVFKKALAE